MNKKLLTLLVGGIGVCALSGSALAQVDDETSASTNVGIAKSKAKPGTIGDNGFEIAQAVSKEEAAKKYPPPRGGYPGAETTQGVNTGISQTFLRSPYPPHKTFDTSGIPRGALILDTRVKKLFVKP